MARAIPLHSDFTGVALRRRARRSKDATQPRRLPHVAAIYEGATRSEAARLGHVNLQIVRDRVPQCNAEGPEELRDRKPPARTLLPTDAHRRAPAAQIAQGSIPAIHGVVRWRLSHLGPWLWDALAALRGLPAARVSVSMQTQSRELRAMGFRKLPARPGHHAQAEGAIEAFKKTSPPRWRASCASRAAVSTR